MQLMLECDDKLACTQTGFEIITRSKMAGSVATVCEFAECLVERS